MDEKLFLVVRIFFVLVPRKEGVPDINTENGYNTLKELCPGKSRQELSEITASCLQLGDDGKVNCNACPTGDFRNKWFNIYYTFLNTQPYVIQEYFMDLILNIVYI